MVKRITNQLELKLKKIEQSILRKRRDKFQDDFTKKESAIIKQMYPQSY